jgi:hypothetical protein
MAADNVYVVAADGDDFDGTVANTVAPDEYDDAPGALSGPGDVRVWGVDDADLFAEMESGDLVLFYADGGYVGVGTVGTTFQDDWAADTLWEAATFEHCFTLERFAPVDLPRLRIHAIFDYSENYYPSTPMRVPDDRVDNSLPAIFEAVRRYEQQA